MESQISRLLGLTFKTIVKCEHKLFRVIEVLFILSEIAMANKLFKRHMFETSASVSEGRKRCHSELFLKIVKGEITEGKRNKRNVVEGSSLPLFLFRFEDFN